MNAINKFYKSRHKNDTSNIEIVKISPTLEMLYRKFDKSVIKRHELAEVLGVSESTVDRIKAAGDIRYKKIGGGVFFALTEVAYYIDEVCDEF